MAVTKEQVAHATDIEDKAGRALSELWVLLVRIMEEVPAIEKMMAMYADRMIPMREQLWDLVKEVREGIELQPFYRVWSDAVMLLANGGSENDLPLHTKVMLREHGEPLHLEAVRRLIRVHQTAEERRAKYARVAYPATAFVLEVEKSEECRKAISDALDCYLGLGNEAWHQWQSMRSAAAAARLAEEPSDEP